MKERTYDTSTGQITLFDDDREYLDFVDKFKPKRTTDDCYTPENIYNAVAEWVENEYGVDKTNFVRPFYPGNDYQKLCYAEKDIVVDNPPFSILSKIIRYYLKERVRFFLFAPALTLLSSKEDVEYLCCGAPITYENGAIVATSFVTNMGKYRVRSCPSLYEIIKIENERNIKSAKKEVPKYKYPDNVITSAFVQRLSMKGIDFKVLPSECIAVSALQNQKKEGKTIFGTGLIVSEKAAAEKAAAETIIEWELTNEEKRIVSELGCGDISSLEVTKHE